jgi:hypothetical protein
MAGMRAVLLPFDCGDARKPRRQRRPAAVACRVAVRDVAAKVRDEVAVEALAEGLASALAAEIRGRLGTTVETPTGDNRADGEGNG